MIKIELEQWQVKALRNYFGLNDKTSLENWAYDVFNKALKEQCNIPDVVVPKGTLVCKDDKKSICNNPMSHECCNKHHKRI